MKISRDIPDELSSRIQLHQNQLQQILLFGRHPSFLVYNL